MSFKTTIKLVLGVFLIVGCDKQEKIVVEKAPVQNEVIAPNNGLEIEFNDRFNFSWMSVNYNNNLARYYGADKNRSESLDIELSFTDEVPDKINLENGVIFKKNSLVSQFIHDEVVSYRFSDDPKGVITLLFSLSIPARRIKGSAISMGIDLSKGQPFYMVFNVKRASGEIVSSGHLNLTEKLSNKISQSEIDTEYDTVIEFFESSSAVKPYSEIRQMAKSAAQEGLSSARVRRHELISASYSAADFSIVGTRAELIKEVDK